MSLFDATEGCHLCDALLPSPTSLFYWSLKVTCLGIPGWGHPFPWPFQWSLPAGHRNTNPLGPSTFSPRDICLSDFCQRWMEKWGVVPVWLLSEKLSMVECHLLASRRCLSGVCWPWTMASTGYPADRTTAAVLTPRHQMLVHDWYRKLVTIVLQLPFSVSQDQSGENLIYFFFENLIFKLYFIRIQNGNLVVKFNRGWHTLMFKK